MWPFTSSKPPTPDSELAPRQDAFLVRDDNTIETYPQPPEAPSDALAEDNPNISSPLAPSINTFQFTGYANERLGMTPIIRVPILLSMSFSIGLILGTAKGGQRHADRYRAENAHRFPTTQAGWYLYQRSKSYHTVVGGVKEGVRFGSVLSLWAAMFMATEEGVDQMRGRLFRRDGEETRRGQRDVLSTMTAALAVAGVYGRWKGLDRYAMAKTSRLALRGSLVFGLVQDLLSTARGERPGYVDWIVKKVRGTREEAAV